MSHFLKIGFELEGGWDGEAGISPFKDITLIDDHSINGQTLQGNPIRATHIGEAVSPPIELEAMEPRGPDGPTAPLVRFERTLWERWLLDHWPNATPPNRTNSTCGFHIHLSTASLRDYALLTSKSLPFELRERLVALGKKVNLPKKHCFWHRMDGKNTFCTLLYDPAMQMDIKDKREINRTRYGWLNFSFGIHGTLEFRALPTFRDAHVAVLFTREYLTFLEEWLDQRKDIVLEREISF